MHLTLIRIYGNSGTNGYLIHDKKVVSKTIELPWRNNRRSESCIPEGLYNLRDRYSPHFGRHLEIMDVPGRDLILFHPANDARHELRGCIAPVTELVGPGLGIQSRMAMQKLMNLVLPFIDRTHACHPDEGQDHPVAPRHPIKASRHPDEGQDLMRIPDIKYEKHPVKTQDLTLKIQT